MKRRITSQTAAFTLVELMLVLGLLVLVGGALIFGYQAFSKAAYKNLCIVNQQNVQDKMRSYTSLNNLAAGDALVSSLFIGTGKLIEVAPVCKAAGTYTYGTTVTATSVAYMSCSVADHAPPTTNGW